MARRRFSQPPHQKSHLQTRHRLTWFDAEYGPGLDQTQSCHIKTQGMKMALVYPNSYHVGMSSLGFQIVYQVATLSGWGVERFFLDTFREGSIESGSPLTSFDLIAFSIAYELDALNLLKILNDAGIPLETTERINRSCPVVIAGGPLVSLNRWPLYPFIDLFLHGDAEAVLPSVLHQLSGISDLHVNKKTSLQSLSQLPGAESTLTPPSHIERLFCPSLIASKDYDFAATHILTPHTEFANMGLIDLARGCPNHCTFCWIGRNAPPYRARSLDSILNAAQRLRPYTKKIGLVASAVGAHPQIDTICGALSDMEMSLSFSSLRIEETSPVMLKTLIEGGQRSITLAPETGSQRLRKMLGKHLSDDQFFSLIEQALIFGAESIKLYFMIGLPTETDEEALEITNLVAKTQSLLRNHAKLARKIGFVRVNLGIFSPKPGIPLNRLDDYNPCDLSTLSERKTRIRRRIQHVMKALGRIPNVRAAASGIDEAFAQTILAMANKENGASEQGVRFLKAAYAFEGDWRRAILEIR